MERKYLYFNWKYFNGQLPDIYEIDFSVNNRKRPMGTASFRYNNLKDCIDRYGISMSNYYDTTERGKESVLLHEMCHISHYFQRISDFLKCDKNGRLAFNRKFDGHSGFFLEEAERVNSMSDYHISKFYEPVSCEEVGPNGLKLSQQAEKKLSKTAYVCIYKVQGKPLRYFYCPKKSIYRFNNMLDSLGATERQWYTTELMNLSGRTKSVKGINFYSRKNPDENNVEFLVKKFNLTPYNPDTLEETVQRVVEDIMDELVNTDTNNISIEASSIPFTMEDGENLIYSIE